jgi:hypothetical protein
MPSPTLEFQGEPQRGTGRPGPRRHRGCDPGQPRARIRARYGGGARVRRRPSDRRVLRRVSHSQHSPTCPGRGRLVHRDDPGLHRLRRDPGSGPSSSGCSAPCWGWRSCADRHDRAGNPRRSLGRSRHRAGIHERPGAGRAGGAADPDHVPVPHPGRPGGDGHRRAELPRPLLRGRDRLGRAERRDDRRRPAARRVTSSRRSSRWPSASSSAGSASCSPSSRICRPAGSSSRRRPSCVIRPIARITRLLLPASSGWRRCR